MGGEGLTRKSSERRASNNPTTRNMQRSIRKSSLQTLIEEKTLSEEGRNWFIEAVDPFHDSRITLCGYPDMNIGSSVIQCVKQTLTIAKPVGFAAGNWDTNVVMWPMPVTQPVTMLFNSTPFGTALLSKSATSGITPYPIGGLTCFSVPSGSQTYGTSSLTTDVSKGISLPENYLGGPCRVLGMGFEVVNTTSQLNVQGQVTVYRQPMPAPQSQFCQGFTTATTLETEKEAVVCPDIEECHRACVSHKHAKLGALPVSLGYSSAYEFVQPPGTQANCMLLEGSQQWEARDGCYSVSTMNTLDNPAKLLVPMSYVSWESDFTSDGTAGSGQALATNQNFASATTQVFVPAYDGYVAPYHLNGAYFTGLSDATTLSLSATWYIERFPHPFEQDLVVLASPSPYYDPAALELYARSMRYLPVGVKQGENPLGEWFTSVLDAVRDYAVPIGKMVGLAVPGVGAVANGAELAINAIRPIAKQVRKKERHKALKKSGRALGPNERSGPGKGQFKRE